MNEYKPWDKKMKRLFREAPLDLLKWLFAGVQLISIVSTELDGETIYTDLLYEVMLNGERFLIHIEFQRKRDSKMAERLWEYNVRATLQYKCPVWSCVVYLKKDRKKDSTVTEPFLEKTLPDGQMVHRFNFQVIKLWEISTEELLEKRLSGLLPLLVLTKNGTRKEVVEEAIRRLTPEGEEPNRELLMLTYGVASLAFEDQDDQKWLVRRFVMLYDILRDTPAYKDIARREREAALQEGLQAREAALQEGLAQGLAQGIAQGIEKANQEHLEATRQTIIKIVSSRFPKTKAVSLVKHVVQLMNREEILQDMVVKLSMAQSLDEVQNHLLNWLESDEGSEEHP